jgi:hypothetical protein
MRMPQMQLYIYAQNLGYAIMTMNMAAADGEHATALADRPHLAERLNAAQPANRQVVL